MKKDLRIVFMGTPEFAVESLKKVLIAGKNVVGVVTSPDKPAGRGQKLSKSAVKLFAEENRLKIMQPNNLKAKNFLEELEALQADLQIVVAFRMLPESVWNMPKFGTFNLHASLLPKYRGAAPINWAIINGEKETGLTTFFLKQEIDTGEIIFREKTKIEANESAGELHDRLMKIGAELVLKTVNAIENNIVKTQAQSDLLTDGEDVPEAPKLFKENCKINWDNSLHEVHDFIRGLSPYPTAWTELRSKNGNSSLILKIYKTKKELIEQEKSSKTIMVIDRQIKVAFPQGNLIIEELQLSGKKRMTSKDFINGIDINGFILE